MINSQTTYDQLIQQAQTSDDVELAQQLCRQAVRRDPKRPAAFYLLASIFLKQQQVDAAIAALSEVVQRAPQDGQAYIDLGELYLSQGKSSAAETCFRSALSLDPDNADAIGALGTIYGQMAARGDIPLVDQLAEFTANTRLTIERLFAEGNTARAVRVSSRLVEFGPGHADDWNNLAVLAHLNEEPAEARRAIDAALCEAPDDPVLQKNSRMIYADGDVRPPAYARLKADPDDEVKRLTAEGRQALEKREWAVAEAAFREVLALRARNIEAALGLARSYEGMERIVDAIVALKKCSDLNPDHPGVKADLKRLLLADLGDHEPSPGPQTATFVHATWDLEAESFAELTPAVITAFHLLSQHNPGITLQVYSARELGTYPWEIIEMAGTNPRIRFDHHRATPEELDTGGIFVYPAVHRRYRDRLAAVSGSALLGARPCAEGVIGAGENGLLVSTLAPVGSKAGPIDVNDLAAKMYFLALDPALVAEMSSAPLAARGRQLEN